MSGGSYDAYYPSSSYAYTHTGDSWRPTEGEDSYERSAHVPARRRTPSPARHHRAYSSYSAGENNYRPTYRSDEENGYYNRTPSPGPSRRDSDPAAWSPWNGSRHPSWRDPDRIQKSPTTLNRFRNETMLATRMHPSSSSWRSNLNDQAARVDQTSGYPDDYPTHDPDTYRQTFATDRYRPEDGYAPRSHYRRFSSPDSSSDPYVRSGHSTVPHSPTAGGYRRDYTSASPVGGPPRRGYTPASVAAERYAPSQSREPGRPEYDSYRPGWSPTSPGNNRRRESLLSSAGRRVVSGQSPARSPSPGQRRASFTRDNRWRPPLRTGSPTSPARDRLMRQRYSRSPDHSMKSSRSNSLRRLNRSRSPGNRSRSRSRSPTSSRSNDDSSGARGRSPRRRSSGIRTASGKAIWDRPMGTVPKKSALNGLRTRSPSRSSIASSRPSERAPSMPVQKPTPPISSTTTGDVIGSTVEQIRKEPNGMDVDELSPPTKIVDETFGAAGGETQAIGQKSNPEPLSRAVERDDDQTPGSTASTREPKAEPTPDLAQMSVDPGNVSEPPPMQTEEPNDTENSDLTSVRDQLLPSGDVPMDVEPKPEGERQPSPPNEEQGDDTPLSIHTPSIPGDRADESIPDRSEAKSRAELLSIVVRTRLLCDRQTRQEIVNPIIISNQIIASEMRVDSRHATNPDELVREMTDCYNHGGGPKHVAKIKASLIERFKEREAFLKEKATRLKAEYLYLHEKWMAHCATLDEQNRTPVTETEMALPTTRSSRRNAVLGDAVRSDLEMEQIIASLGIDDATDPAHLSLRNLAKVPDMISVTKGKVDYHYDDTNHMVQNPAEYYGPHTGIHDWTTEEKEVFNARFAAHPKQFGAIAEYLPNKTAAQCVDYYYLHKKKFVDFRKVVARYGPNKRKRKGTGKNKRNALLADIRQHDAEVNRDGVASPTGRPGRGKRTPVPPPDSKDKEGAKETRRTVSTRRRFLQVEDNTPMVSETPTPEPELKTRRGRRPATVVVNTIPPSTLPTAAPPTPTPVSTDVVDRAISINTEETEDVSTDMERPAKRAKRTRRIKSAAIVEEADTPEPEAEPSASDLPETSTKGKVPAGAQWSDEDKQLFLGLLGQHGDDFKRISASMPNKTTLQITNFYNTHLIELDLASIVAKAPKRSPSQADVRPKKTVASVTTSRSASPILRLTPDSVRAQQAATLGSSGAQDKPRSNPSEANKSTSQQKEPAPVNGFQRERGSLPATAQYSYYDHLRHAQPTVYHPGYTQHRSALGPHLPSAVHTMSYVHNPPGMPAYPAHAYHSGYVQYPEVHYPPYHARYAQPSSPPPQVATDANGNRRFAPIRPRDNPYSYATHAGHPSYHYPVGKPNHAP